MQQINPQQLFPIVRQLGDPTDNGTNYVQATVRNSTTGQLLATVDLTDQGGQRFTSLYQVPADVSGNGYYLDIETIVYANSSYTTKNVNYGIIDDAYLVLVPINYAMIGGGGGGADVDYKRIEKMILAIEFPKHRNPSLQPYFEALKKEVVKGYKRLEKKETDLSPVTDHLRDVMKMIKAIDIPVPKDPEPVDLMPVLEGIQNVAESLGDMHDGIGDHFKKVRDHFDSKEVDVTGQLKDFLESVPEETSRAMAGILMFGSSMKKSKTETKKSYEVDPRIKDLFK